jgi:hypothetical protein
MSDNKQFMLLLDIFFCLYQMSIFKFFKKKYDK